MSDTFVTALAGSDAGHTLLAHEWDGPGAWWPVFPLVWLLVIGGVVTAVVLSGRRRRRTAGPMAGQARLAERFAAGEITEQEYRERLHVLTERRR